MRKKNYKCLMIETKDHRQFFTHEKNFGEVVEFANVFGAAVSLVKIGDGDVLDLAPLAEAISNIEYKADAANIKLISTKVPLIRKQPRNTQNAGKIRCRLRELFLTEGKIINLHDAWKEFKSQGVSYHSFCNQMSYVRKTLTKEGHQIKKLGAGTYMVDIKKKKDDLDTFGFYDPYYGDGDPGGYEF